VLKADVLGSLEAITGQLEKMRNPEVGAAVIGKGLGNINESDVLRAEGAGGVVMGFNVVATREAEILARDKNVQIHLYKVIYHLFDEVKKRLQTLLPAEVIRTDLGKLEVLGVFHSDKSGQVVGGRVTDGKLVPAASIVVYRSGEPVGEGHIVQLQLGKSETKEVRSGQECGMKVKCKTGIQIGDVIEAFMEERKEKKLEFTE
ncbi:translation initiation factor IF-2, partial [Candidatus Uhrbacteria bacterium]|nr:translation initiation factor IF-2 [Candidatus Uhrbacteria bacterium]